uniref:Phosphatidylethanolamine N-methyltransferase n=1 Tax=Bos indicus x Bos taurus TaxID=30522 RepID=A0A4W2EFC6_BOBOX
MGPVLGVGGFLEARARSLQGNPRPTSPGRAGPVRSSVAAPDCCGGLGNLDFRKADLCIMTRLLGYVDLSEPHFVAAVLAIVFNPLFWNVVARWEHKTRKLSKAFGSPRLACYTLGGAILLLNVLRSHCFTQAMLSQPRMQSLDNPAVYHVGLALLGVGGVFVLSSFLALGFTGTFLGKTLSVGGQGPAPPNSRPQPALLSAGGQTLKPQPAAWPPGWAGLLFLCSGLGLATGGGAGPSPCPWLRSFGAENPVLAGLDVLQTPTPSLGLWGEGAGRLMCAGQWGQSRRPARDHITQVPEGHAGDWGVLPGGGSHRGGPLGAQEQVGIIVWASQGWGGEGSQGREGWWCSQPQETRG